MKMGPIYLYCWIGVKVVFVFCKILLIIIIIKIKVNLLFEGKKITAKYKEIDEILDLPNSKI